MTVRDAVRRAMSAQTSGPCQCDQCVAARAENARRRIARAAELARKSAERRAESDRQIAGTRERAAASIAMTRRMARGFLEALHK